jgi:hypothetical protein
VAGRTLAGFPLLRASRFGGRALLRKADVAGKIVIPDTGLSEDEKVVHLLNRIGYDRARATSSG